MKATSFRAAVSAISLLGLAGCATIIDGQKDNVYVQSSPVDGAKCTLSNASATYYVTTPGLLTIPKSKRDLSMVCEKPGFAPQTQIVSSRFRPTTFGNVVVGGAVGVGVDAFSGAMFKYPPAVQVDMTPQALPTPLASSQGS